jgi:hypothetical protein
MLGAYQAAVLTPASGSGDAGPPFTPFQVSDGAGGFEAFEVSDGAGGFEQFEVHD